MDNIEEFRNKKETFMLEEQKKKKIIQHNLNKLTARERIEQIFDKGSFIEIGEFIGKNGAGVITGYGTINSRLAYAFSQDYTVSGGALDNINSKKIFNIMDMAIKMGAPLIKIFDSAGGKVEEGIELLSSYGKLIKKCTELSGVVPQISIIAGPCTGMLAVCASMSDFTIMVKNVGELYISAPNKIIKKEEKYVDKNYYGSAEFCSKNASVQLLGEDDKDAIYMVRKIFNYIPSNNVEISWVNAGEVELNIKEELNEASKCEVIDIDGVLKCICDKYSILELGHNFSKVRTLLSKINGIPIGIITDSFSKGNEEIDIKACEKITRFTKFCSSFNISILSLVNTEGFNASIVEENQGLSLNASKMIYALAEAEVPKVALIMGKAFGAGFVALGSKDVAFDAVYAWPNAQVSLTHPKTLIKMMHKEEIINRQNPKEEEEKIINKYMSEAVNVYKAAEEGLIDNIIMPSETKIRLFATFDMLQSKRVIKYPKKHGSTLI